jgi:hypothetical protein
MDAGNDRVDEAAAVAAAGVGGGGGVGVGGGGVGVGVGGGVGDNRVDDHYSFFFFSLFHLVRGGSFFCLQGRHVKKVGPVP